MKVRVDSWKCQGHMVCCGIAPTVFVWDDERSYTVASEGDVPAELEGAVREAEAGCPEMAVIIED